MLIKMQNGVWLQIEAQSGAGDFEPPSRLYVSVRWRPNEIEPRWFRDLRRDIFFSLVEGKTTPAEVFGNKSVWRGIEGSRAETEMGMIDEGGDNWLTFQPARNSDKDYLKALEEFLSAHAELFTYKSTAGGQ